MARRRFHQISALAIVVVAVAAQYALVLNESIRPGWWRPASVAEAPKLTRDDLASANNLDAAFDRMGYRLDTVAEGRAVPRLSPASIPSDMTALPDGDARKEVFLRLMLPLVLEADEEIAADRRRLVSLLQHQNAGEALAPSDSQWLDDLAKRYEVRPGPATVARLLRRVDVVPPSLALAQAALETGWGTSRLVVQANNLFGHTIDTRGEGANFATFATLGDAVRAYIHNLNTHRAYTGLRRTRASAHAQGSAVNGNLLAGTLSPYSELGRAYVEAVRTMIRANDLGRLDHARLKSVDTSGNAI